jgi:4,4'-diaponeurosporenoate glycosyltransferase
MPLLPRNNSCPADSISVVIPARNEAKTLPLLLSDLTAQIVQPCEIIVVNDNSEDETAQIAQSFGARVITLSEKPDGWVGKCWACQQGAETATGDSLLFLDADVRLSPDALGRIAAAHAQHGAVSIQPYHATSRIIEDLALFFNLAQVCAIGSALPRPVNLGLFGPVIALRRQDYFAFHGHEPVKSVVLEDMALADCLRGKQIPFRLFIGDCGIRYRMYDGFCALWQGFTKNLASAAAKTPLWLFLLVTLFFASLASAPLHFFLSLFSGGALLWMYGAFWLVWVVCLSIIGRRLGGFRPLSLLLYPVPLLVFFAVFLNSCFVRLFRGTVKWKGRAIRPDR